MSTAKNLIHRLVLKLGDPRFGKKLFRVALCLVTVVMMAQDALPALAQDGDPPAGGGEGDGGGGGAGGLAGLVALGVRGLIILTGLLLCFGIAFTGFKATLAKWAGIPAAEAQAIMTVISLILLLLLVAFSIPLSNAVVKAVTSSGDVGQEIYVPDL